METSPSHRSAARQTVGTNPQNRWKGHFSCSRGPTLLMVENWIVKRAQSRVTGRCCVSQSRHSRRPMPRGGSVENDRLGVAVFGDFVHSPAGAVFLVWLAGHIFLKPTHPEMKHAPGRNIRL